jgi:hypothetical protein
VQTGSNHVTIGVEEVGAGPQRHAEVLALEHPLRRNTFNLAYTVGEAHVSRRSCGEIFQPARPCVIGLPRPVGSRQSGGPDQRPDNWSHMASIGPKSRLKNAVSIDAPLGPNKSEKKSLSA